MIKLGMRVFWNHGPIPVTTRKNARLAMTVPFGTVMNLGGGGTGGGVDSVNGKVGPVFLNASDVGADSAGSAAAVRGELQPQIAANTQALASKADNLATSVALATKATVSQLNEVKGLAESNELKLSTKAEQADIEQLTAAVSEKVSQAEYNALVQACALLASRDFVIEQINGLLGGVSIDFDTLKEIADRLQLDSDQFGVITNALSKRIRFDASQTLTSAEQNQVLSNINAEKAGTASALVAAITPASIGAATAAQGDKATTALQSGDVAPVALSGSFSDLVNKLSLFNLVYPAYSLGANLALTATDSLGTMLGKAQGQIDAIWTALGTKADATSTLALINQKVSSALLGAVNGVATLGADGKVPAAQLPATSGIIWQNLTIVSGATVSNDPIYPMQMGKDSRNNVYVRGMFTNTKNGVLDANLSLFTIPNDLKLSTTATTTMQGVLSCSIFRPLQTTQATGYVSFRTINNVQEIGLTVALATAEKVHINEQVIGFLA